MAVTAQMVKELREMTGAGMMDCKKALVEVDGDIDKAVELLREKGLSKAAKKAGRVAAEGLVQIAFGEGHAVCLIGILSRFRQFKPYDIVWVFSQILLFLFGADNIVGRTAHLACASCLVGKSQSSECFDLSHFEFLSL